MFGLPLLTKMEEGDGAVKRGKQPLFSLLREQLLQGLGSWQPSAVYPLAAITGICSDWGGVGRFYQEGGFKFP